MNWYLDPENGDDSFNGQRANQPKKTFASILAAGARFEPTEGIPGGHDEVVLLGAPSRRAATVKGEDGTWALALLPPEPGKTFDRYTAADGFVPGKSLKGPAPQGGSGGEADKPKKKAGASQ